MHDSLGGQDTFQDSANRKCLHKALELQSRGIWEQCLEEGVLTIL